MFSSALITELRIEKSVCSVHNQLLSLYNNVATDINHCTAGLPMIRYIYISACVSIWTNGTGQYISVYVDTCGKDLHNLMMDCVDWLGK